MNAYLETLEMIFGKRQNWCFILFIISFSDSDRLFNGFLTVESALLQKTRLVENCRYE